MQIKVTAKKTAKTDALVIPIFKGAGRVPALLNVVDKKLIGRLMKNKEFMGERGETALDLSAGTVTKLLLLGLGDKDKLNLDGLYRATGAAVLKLKRSNSSEIALWLPKEVSEKFDAQDIGQMMAEGALISGYTFNQYKKDKKPGVKTFLILPEDKKSESGLAKGVKLGDAIASSVNMVRDLSNTPSNDMTPSKMGEHAVAAGKEFSSLKVEILGRKEIEKEGMGGLLGVAKGSAQEPKFIVMEYWGAGKDSKSKPIVLVGKGITFDTGGISIKPSANLEEMKFDMAGAAAVIGTLRTVVALKLPLNVIGLAPTTENMPGGNAYKPGDILKISDGTTVEVINTDAEGRLILADALVYARRYKPEIVVDAATLTGACVVALGDYAAGLFTQDDKLREELSHAALHTGDHVWAMPIYDEYADRIKSSIADIRNLSTSSYGGSITAALFLKHFVKDFRWAHVDIAGTAWATGGNSFMEPGATGAGVRLFTQWLREKSKITK